MLVDYTYNTQYLMKDGVPWLPVMGEMHYSRYKDEFWEESLRKIKAGGVTVVACYVFWLHHEEEEGVFDFSGCRDIRKFVELCGKVGLGVFLRIGPWAHGEARNGGFPDWLIHKEIPLRCDGEEYLELVKRFWAQVFNQVEGQMHEDGGPVIGIQIENEYGHVGGIQGEEGEQHMRTLTAMAKQIGFKTPLYTATGWGGAVTGGLLPVMGGYCEAPWNQSLGEIEANDNYVFSGKRNDANIASDHHIQDELTFNVEDFPYLTAELGGGLQVTHHRRPVATGKDIGAMSLTKLGSGVGLIGYYMYHGGSNPKGKFSTLQESKATGYLNDLPEINYDFNAPIRQYGQISDTYKEIKLLGLFSKDFGSDMTTLKEDIEDTHISPEDMDTLRLSWRHDASHGYVFFNNYQRRRQMRDHKDVQLIGKCENPVVFPSILIDSGAYGFFPYHMQLEDKELIWAVATPLCKLEGEGEKCYVFYGEWEPAFNWKDNKAAKVVHITREEALNAWKVTLDRDYLVIAEEYVWEEEGKLSITGAKETKIKCFPEMTRDIPGFVKVGEEGSFSVYERKIEGKDSSVVKRLVECTGTTKIYELEIEYSSGIEDCFVSLTYAGDGFKVYCQGEMVNDHFYTGQTVELSMRYFGFPKKLQIEIDVLHENAAVFLETWPKMIDGKACELIDVVAKDKVR